MLLGAFCTLVSAVFWCMLRVFCLWSTAPAHLRYSGTAGKPPSMPFSLEGLCPHHEQAFAAQLMAQQLQNMTGGNEKWFHAAYIMYKIMFASKLWSCIVIVYVGLVPCCTLLFVTTYWMLEIGCIYIFVVWNISLLSYVPIKV